MTYELLRDTKLAEGCKLVAYRDTKGLWTIGYGHLLDQSIDWTGHEITQETADALLEQDLNDRGVVPASKLPEWASLDTDCRRNALTELVFNMGVTHWVTEFPHARAYMKDQEWLNLYNELTQRSPKWVQDVGVRRVGRIAGYFLRGSYSPVSDSPSHP